MNEWTEYSVETALFAVLCCLCVGGAGSTAASQADRPSDRLRLVKLAVSDAIAQTICCVAPPGLRREKAGKEAAAADEFELRG